ncbi:DNA translocase FtsK [Paenibacillus turpanensis]|uniref:DNA translocase FtsK n=1 Tax=Paenibacillus turpanensis TaxID=2689078 RepID=UPI00140BF2E0|nr:DNA translocase FtsK [Paenibacillus turpanensis]
MAKRKKRTTGKSLKTSVKFELYGIIILILSVIALSRQGTVAHSLTYMFRFLIGQWDWVIPLVFIFTAIRIMIRREWPAAWSSRKTGILLVLLGFVLMSHIDLFARLHPVVDYTAGSILSESWLFLIDGMTSGERWLKLEAGGGMAGAAMFSVLFMLFDIWGARLIQYTLFILGFLLITGKSYVDIVQKVREVIRAVFRQLGIRAKEVSGEKQKSGGALKRSKAKPEKKPVFTDDFDEETYFEKPAGKKKGTLFFELLQKPKSAASAQAEDWDEDDEPSLDDVILRDKSASAKGKATPHDVNPFEDEPFEPLQEDEPKQEFKNVTLMDVPETADEGYSDSPALVTGATDQYPEELAQQPAQQAELTDAALLDEEGEANLIRPDSPEQFYQLPPFSLLNRPQGGSKGSSGSNDEGRRKLASTLESFGIKASVGPATIGPAVTRYEVYPEPGVKVSRIVSLTDDIALALAAKDIRMEAPIPGKSAIGIEVPNTEVSMVTLREVMESSVFHESSAKLTIALGRDISGTPIVANLARMPHLLVAGATGSGKSVCINGIITSILYKAKPDEVKFLMIDPKMVELNVYNGIPHLLAPVVTDPRRASLALKKVVVEMEKRYELFSKSGTRNMEGYNNLQRQNNQPLLPFIVVIVDELADLMMVAAGDVEDAICRLAQMARAAGIHLIIATQRPSVDVITGVIKANIPSRIAFGVSSQVDSRTILDSVGAEKLLGRGDMLFMPVGASKPLRVQGAFLSDDEVEAVVTYSRNQAQAEYREELVPEIEESGGEDDLELDELFDQAVQIVVEAKQASVSLLQRRMRVGYTRAARLIDTMEAKGIVGPYEGSKPREVLMSLEQLQQSRIPS